MKHSWASITQATISQGNFLNHGNLLIEEALQGKLNEIGLPPPTFVFDAFEDKVVASEINKTDFLIIPGCTTLNISDYPGLVANLKQNSINI